MWFLYEEGIILKLKFYFDAKIGQLFIGKKVLIHPIGMKQFLFDKAIQDSQETKLLKMVASEIENIDELAEEEIEELKMLKKMELERLQKSNIFNIFPGKKVRKTSFEAGGRSRANSSISLSTGNVFTNFTGLSKTQTLQLAIETEASNPIWNMIVSPNYHKQQFLKFVWKAVVSVDIVVAELIKIPSSLMKQSFLKPPAI